LGGLSRLQHLQSGQSAPLFIHLEANSALTVLVTNGLTEARAEIKTLQVGLEQSRSALPVSKAVPTPADDPAPSPVIATKTAKKPTTKAKPPGKPTIKRGKVKI